VSLEYCNGNVKGFDSPESINYQYGSPQFRRSRGFVKTLSAQKLEKKIDEADNGQDMFFGKLEPMITGKEPTK